MSAKHGCLITVPFRSPPAPSSVPPSPPAVLMVNDDECPAPAAAAGTREWEVGGGGNQVCKGQNGVPAWLVACPMAL